MSDDDVAANLVARLRQYEGGMSQTTMCYNGTREEAAATIERLTRERDENFLKWQNLRLGGAQDWQARAEELSAQLAKVREGLIDAIDVFDGMADDEIEVELLPRLRAALAVKPKNADDHRPPLPIVRCDVCDNGIDPKWPFCAWCGAPAKPETEGK